MIAAILVAAGRGTRAGSAAGAPKQYAELAGKPLLLHTLAPFLAHPAIALVQVVIHADDRPLYDSIIPNVDKIRAPVSGGATRHCGRSP